MRVHAMHITGNGSVHTHVVSFNQNAKMHVKAMAMFQHQGDTCNDEDRLI